MSSPENRLILEWAEKGPQVTLANGYLETIRKFEDAQEAAQWLAEAGLAMKEPFEDFGGVLCAEVHETARTEQPA